MMTAREQFTTVLAAGPLLRADAICVLAGEDATPRLEAAAELFRMHEGKVKLLVTGGKDEPPRIMGAESVTRHLHGMGIKPDRIAFDATTLNTREQAVGLVKYATQEQWGRVLLVASAYHLPRAYLTVVQALTEAGALETVHVLPVPASHSPWFQSPPGMTETRLDLVGLEYTKIDLYRKLGHVASYADGLAYLKRWEGR